MIRCLMAGLTCVGSGGALASGGLAPEASNPYVAIVVQNVFRLRPKAEVKVAQDKSRLPPPAQATIRVTGFTDVCGRSQVLLEISEQGKAVVRRVLAVGEQFMGIEAEAVDVGGMWARLRVNGEPTEATFSTPGAPPSESIDLKLRRK